MQKLKFEYRIIAGYIIIGGLWIIFSDKLLNYFIRDPDLLTRIQTFKGWFYVLITAILFYTILKSHLIKIRNAEQKAIDSDRLKTAFLQNISHEIRTPMNSILGFFGLLKDKNTSDTEKTDYLEMISKSSDQLLNIVNEVLDISLNDTGIGIDSEFHQKIFERFHKVEQENIRLYEGVGLGLAICKGNIDLLKGKIWIESEVGKGSKFFFKIP